MLITLRRPDIALLIAVLALTACDSRKPAATTTPPASRATAVTAAPPLRQDVAVIERSVGQLESLITPEVAAEVEGRILRGFAKNRRARHGRPADRGTRS